MSLSSLVDKPLIQNPLAGGGQLGGLTFRQEGDMGRYVADNDPGGIAAGFSNLQDYLAAGNKLPEQQVSLLGAGSNANFNTSPPGTLLDNSFSNITAPGQIPDRYKQGFEDFYRQNPDNFMRIGGQAISYVTTPQGETIRFGDTGGATNFRRYLESIGETPRDDSLSLAQGSGPLQPTRPEQNPNAIRVPADPIQTGGLGDQGLMDRLTSLEQGIGSLQNQIANLFQTQQTSDPFGLGSFMNTRRF
jgi:hypothetical protein